MDRATIRANKSSEFDPDGVGLKNGRFIGLPFDEEESEVIVMTAPWDVTVSFGSGTADGPEAVLRESSQLDLEDPFLSEGWKKGIYVRHPDAQFRERSQRNRLVAEDYIAHLEAGGAPATMATTLSGINDECEALHQEVYLQSRSILENGQTPGLLGGDHSTPYGLIRASLEKYPQLGILQVDAHMDLREAYEGFTWSHASIFRNVMERLPLSRLVQVGIRDYCSAEWSYAMRSNDRIQVFRDRDIRERLFQGGNYDSVVAAILERLPQEVHISFDIDGLDPSLCPGTGTPVPGGLSFNEAVHLLESVKRSGRRIVSFDLCETGKGEWDANVGARILYKLALLAG